VRVVDTGPYEFALVFIRVVVENDGEYEQLDNAPKLNDFADDLQKKLEVIFSKHLGEMPFQITCLTKQIGCFDVSYLVTFGLDLLSDVVSGVTSDLLVDKIKKLFRKPYGEPVVEISIHTLDSLLKSEALPIVINTSGTVIINEPKKRRRSR